MEEVDPRPTLLLTPIYSAPPLIVTAANIVIPRYASPCTSPSPYASAYLILRKPLLSLV